MPLVARSTSVSVANPALVFYGVSAGWLVDVFELSFQIFAGAAQVYPVTPGNRQTVNLTSDRLGKGRYVAAWTVSGSEALGAHEVRWFYRLTSGGAELAARTPFHVVASLSAGGPYYAAPADLADEGLSSATEARQLHALSTAAQLVETYTRTFFEPRYLDVLLDGHGGQILHMDHAVSALESVSIGGVDLDPENLAVYNRHLGGLLGPDDRKNPKLVRQSGCWSRGALNIEVKGVFGALVQGAPWGDIDPRARYVTKLIALRELALMSDAEARGDARDRHRIVSESTRDQSYSLGPHVAAGRGAGPPIFTGDFEIDSLLAALRGPMRTARP